MSGVRSKRREKFRRVTSIIKTCEEWTCVGGLLIINYLLPINIQQRYVRRGTKTLCDDFFPLNYVKNICQSRFLVETANIAALLSRHSPGLDQVFNVLQVL